MPTEGAAVETSYTKCGVVQNEHATPGDKRNVPCGNSPLKTQFVIIQSLGAEAKKLCLAEVTVHEEGKPMRSCS